MPRTARPQFCCTKQSNTICVACAEKKHLLATDTDFVVEQDCTNYEDAALYCDYCDIRIASTLEITVEV